MFLWINKVSSEFIEVNIGTIKNVEHLSFPHFYLLISILKTSSPYKVKYRLNTVLNVVIRSVFNCFNLYNAFRDEVALSFKESIIKTCSLIAVLKIK
jgi:hypothetical protein